MIQNLCKFGGIKQSLGELNTRANEYQASILLIHEFGDTEAKKSVSDLLKDASIEAMN